MDLSKLTMTDKILAGTGLALVIDLLFLPWHSVDLGFTTFSITGVEERNAFLGVLALLLAAAVAAVTLIRALKPEGGEAAIQSVPSVLPPLALHRHLLSGLEVSETHRTNLGLANVGEESVQFALGLEIVPGRFVETASFSVPGYTTLQLALQQIFPVLARGAGLRVAVEPGGANGFAYASVIENSTSNARFVLPSPYVSAAPR